MANPWFRLYAEFSHDPKVQMMPEEMQRRLIMLFCAKCSDVLVTFRERDIAFHWRISEQELADTKTLFMENGFIDKHWNVLNWDKRQYISDSSTPRTRRWRERNKTSRERHGNDREHEETHPVTAPDTEAYTDTEAKAEAKKTKTKTTAVVAFAPPDWVDKELWDDFEESRRKVNKKPLTDRARKVALGKLERFNQQGYDVKAIMEETVGRAWLMPLATDQTPRAKRSYRVVESPEEAVLLLTPSYVSRPETGVGAAATQENTSEYRSKPVSPTGTK